MTLDIRRSERRVPAPAPLLSVLVTERRRLAERDVIVLLEESTARAAHLVAEAEREAERIRAAERERARVEAERRWAEAALALAQRRSAALEDLEPSCVRLALEIARQIVGHALREDADMFLEVAERACAPLRRDAELLLLVSEADGDRLGPLRERLGAWRAVRIEAHPELTRGDCIAECNGVRVDARLDVQLEVIERHLLGAASEVGP
jgi:flagellar biosynthesis/type III secretory pathway protein FliH